MLWLYHYRPARDVTNVLRNFPEQPVDRQNISVVSTGPDQEVAAAKQISERICHL